MCSWGGATCVTSNPQLQTALPVIVSAFIQSIHTPKKQRGGESHINHGDHAPRPMRCRWESKKVGAGKIDDPAHLGL